MAETKERIAYRVNWNRHHRLSCKGKQVYGLHKRPKPDNCELCGKATKRLDYHHWNDDKLDVGMWLCLWCHGFAERTEAGLLGKYEALKRDIEATWPMVD